MLFLFDCGGFPYSGGKVRKKGIFAVRFSTRDGFFWAVAIVMLVTCRLSFSRQEHTACVRDTCFTVEVAVSPEQKARGLMFRGELGPDQGMLFLYPDQARRTFWMKNTFIPLDIIWIDSALTVVGITKNAQPCRDQSCPRYESPADVQYVLEVNAGSAEKIGLQNGDTFTFCLQ